MAQQAQTECDEMPPATECAAAAEVREGASPGDAPCEDGDDGESLASLREVLQQAQDEAATERDRALRAVAEAENTRKRADRSIANAHKFALEKFVGDLLPAIDSFERAVEAAAKAESQDETAQAIVEGVELSLKLLNDAMQKQGIAVVDPTGAPFDPNLHEAMSMIESATAEPGSVLEVFQKGYTINGRLARPARVIVARQPTTSDAAAAPPDTDAAATDAEDGSESAESTDGADNVDNPGSA